MTTFTALKIEVPIACFRQSHAREYIETYPVPPPSTVYGMLLSLVGEMDRYKHCGVGLAIALLSEPRKSTSTYCKKNEELQTSVRLDCSPNPKVLLRLDSNLLQAPQII